MLLQLTFLKNGTKSLPKLTSENLKNRKNRTGALLGVISGIHRVHTNPKNPMDVRNDTQQGISTYSSRLFFKLSDENLGSDLVPFFKKVTCSWMYF
jgi:hypothetical protein